MTRTIVLLLLAAACTRVPATSRARAAGGEGPGPGGGGAGGAVGEGGGGAAGFAGVPGPWSVPEDGRVDPLLLAADESHAIYGVHGFTEGSGSLHVLVAGGEAFEASPSVLLAFPEQTFLQPPPGVLPAPGGELLVAAVPPDPGARWEPPYLVAVRAFVIATRTWSDLVPAAAYGVWAFVPGTEDLLYVDGDRSLRRISARGGASRVMAERVIVRGGYPFGETAALSPRGDRLSVNTEEGPALIDLRTDRLRLLGPPAPRFRPPAFASDGTRVAIPDAGPDGEAFTVLDVETLAGRTTPRAEHAVLAEDMRHALGFDGQPFTATLVDTSTGASTELGRSVARASFAAQGRFVWLADDTSDARFRLRDVYAGGEEVLPIVACEPSPWIELDDEARLIVFPICGQSRRSVLRRADGAVFDLGGGVPVVADPRGLLAIAYESSGNGRLHTFLTRTGELHDRGLSTFTLAANASSSRVLVNRPRPDGDLVLIDPLDPEGTWPLGTGPVEAWALGERRVAWSDGERVWLADAP